MSNSSNQILKKFLNELSWMGEFSGISEILYNTVSHYGNNPLHIAAVRNRVDLIEMLFDLGAELDAKGEHGYTPLHEAVEQNNIEAVELLLKLGADQSIKNDHGMTAMDVCKNDKKYCLIIAKLLER